MRTQEAEHPDRSASQAVLVALRRIMRAIDLHSHQLVQLLGVTGPQLIVLQELARGDGTPVGTLAKAVALSPATVTGIVSRLEKRGLVQRRDDEEDRRRVLVEVTPTARELLATAPPPMQESFIREFERLEDWERGQILSNLQRVVAMMEATELDAAPILATGSIDGEVGKAERKRDK